MKTELSKKDLALCVDCACFNIRKATRVITQNFDEIMQPSGVRATQFTILVMIASSDAATMSELADKLVMDRTTLTRNLKPLREQGLIKDIAGADRRMRSISLTTKGRKLLLKALPLWKKAQTRMTQYLGAERFADLLGELRSIERLSAPPR
jgi:DNA-binding MarR family transcriptional regulator